MAIASMTIIDIALLESEMAEHSLRCPVCHQRVGDEPWVAHATGCEMNEALAERGYPTRESRDAARSLIRQSRAATLPPPAGAST
jgi:hypothetical protein